MSPVLWLLIFIQISCHIEATILNQSLFTLHSENKSTGIEHPRYAILKSDVKNLSESFWKIGQQSTSASVERNIRQRRSYTYYGAWGYYGGAGTGNTGGLRHTAAGVRMRRSRRHHRYRRHHHRRIITRRRIYYPVSFGGSYGYGYYGK
ncbi:hypothetical protein DdX_01185 [Ditylenchus destructor]|uniref:Uncharacterized protein n=1 Tax=Ditylenchus destructor TaxID=166010 RepID=A0AAD4NIS7_9BILA|nr:hypothetical protein DdX_01185 [Ditylenchus destructor]